MFDHCHYVPIVKTKKGERDAVELLAPQTKMGFTPLWEIAGDYEDIDSVSLSALKNLANNIRQAWQHDRPCFVDASNLQNFNQVAGKHPVETLFDQLYFCGVRAIPVLSPDSPAIYQQAIQNIVSVRKDGLCIRLSPDYEEGDQSFGTEIDSVLEEFNIEAMDCDIVIDLWTTDISSVGLFATAIVNTINSINRVADFRTLTLAASSFPRSMTGIPKGISTSRRLDWILWTNVLSKTPLSRKPSYGDYTCLNPEVIEFDPMTMTPSAKIRYASQNEWLIVKGGRLKNNGGQYHNLAANLIARQEYMGASFSWGDSYIEGCAQKTCGPGNLQKWVTVDVNHHITYVLYQLSTTVCSNDS